MNIGSHIGQYKLVRKIGAGGMGTVFVGEHILLGRRAAIKTLLPALSVQSELVERFFNEARAQSAITDAGIAQVFDFGYHVDGSAYIVMELLEGESLAARLDRLGRLPAAEALRIARQVAGALAAAHAANVIHRDLKPDNVFLVRDAEAHGGERAKLLDFGICKLDTGDASLTQTGAMLGTPVYMSPEQCHGDRTLDGRSDIYGLGCVMFQMLTGRTPFEAEGAGDLIVAHLQHEPPVPSSRVPELAAIVDEVVLRCLAKSPAERFQSMTALQHAIDQILPALTPAPVIEAPTKLALAAGFKSQFDGNFPGSPTVLPKRTGMATPDWFVATPTPTTMRSAVGVIDDTQSRPASKKPLYAIVLAGIVVALLGTGLSTLDVDDDESSALAAPVATDAGLPPADVLIDAPIARTVPRPDAAAAMPAPDAAVAEPPPVVDAPKPQPKRIDPPVVRRQPPQPQQVRRVVREPQPQKKPPEDLYDSR